MKYLSVLILFLWCSKTYSQELMQLIGLDVDNSIFSKQSYGALYSLSDDDDEIYYPYTPYKTLGIYRNGDSIKVKSVDYLVVPSDKGFRYATLNVKEIENTEKEKYPQNQYEVYESITIPVFFNSKEKIRNFIKELKPTFKDAVMVDFQQISFICPQFYTTSGFESEVYGGALWFGANQTMNIFPLDWKKGKISNRVSDYLSNSEKNKIIWDTLRKRGDNLTEEVEPTYHLYFEGSIIKDYKKVYFDFSFQGNGIIITPFTLLNSNSSRAYLAEGQVIENQKLYKIFNLTKPTQTSQITLISLDQSTKTLIKKNKILIYDNITGRPLSTIYIHFNKLIMNEYATQKYIQKWRNEF